jgi:phage shock protein C
MNEIEKLPVLKGGVVGVGEYFDIDPTLLRLAYLIIAIMTAVFPAVVAYLVACLVVPTRPLGMD